MENQMTARLPNLPLRIDAAKVSFLSVITDARDENLTLNIRTSPAIVAFYPDSQLDVMN
jgi:hypothetical protein